MLGNLLKIILSMSNEKIRREGIVHENLSNGLFRVVMDDDGSTVLAHLSGKMRLHYIKVLLGDKVIIEFSPYDTKKGRIVQRLKI